MLSGARNLGVKALSSEHVDFGASPEGLESRALPLAQWGKAAAVAQWADQTAELRRITERLVRDYQGRVAARQVALTVAAVVADVSRFDSDEHPSAQLVELISRDELNALASGRPVTVLAEARAKRSPAAESGPP